MSNFILKYDVLLTHDGVLAKEDVDKSDILLPGIVELTHLRAKPNSFSSSDRALASFSGLACDFETRRLSVCLLLIGLGKVEM